MNSEKFQKYLPIGTVVLLKQAKKRVMITGFCVIPEEDKTKIYDYIGVIYPEGSLNSQQCLMFNHDQIEKLYHLGLADEEEKAFKTSLNQAIAEGKLKTTYKDLNSTTIPTEIRISE